MVCEVEMMKSLGLHDNIVRFLGCCADGSKFSLVMEFLPNGNLKDYLRLHKTYLGYEQSIGVLADEDLVYFAIQIVRGMSFLASQRVRFYFGLM